MSPVSVRVPGSTSNCGAGFDTLGLALQIYNRVTLTPLAGLPGLAQAERPSDARAAGMVAEVVDAFRQKAASADIPGFSYRIEGDVPPARGLGSSVTVLAGVMAGLNHWAGSPLSPEDIAAELTRLEGHPDNATAGVLGGFCVARCGATPAEYAGLVRIEVDDRLRFVVVSPVIEVATVGVAIGTVWISTPLRSTRYSVTPMLSVEAVHVRSTAPLALTTAARFRGTEGFVLSAGSNSVVLAERFPAVSTARTKYRSATVPAASWNVAP